MTPALALDAAKVRRAGRVVLDAASVIVAAGEVVGVVGPNGAGKTTLLRAALGLARLDAGRAQLAGRDVRMLSEPELAARAAYLPQERRVGWNMTAWRIASLGAFARPPVEARARAEAALALAEGDRERAREHARRALAAIPAGSAFRRERLHEILRAAEAPAAAV